MSEANLPDADSVAAKAGVEPEVVRAVYEAIAAETAPVEASGSSHKVNIPLTAVVPSANISNN